MDQCGGHDRYFRIAWGCSGSLHESVPAHFPDGRAQGSFCGQGLAGCSETQDLGDHSASADDLPVAAIRHGRILQIQTIPPQAVHRTYVQHDHNRRFDCRRCDSCRDRRVQTHIECCGVGAHLLSQWVRRRATKY